jgi:YesN/AraC family two-component response regulator
MLEDNSMKNLKNISLLYVEDDDTLREIISEHLSTYIDNILVANCGKEGLEIFEKEANNIDIVITDINMPGIDGIEMSKRIKELNPNIKTVIMTAYSDDQYLREAVNLGIEHYLLKPVTIDNIFNILIRISQENDTKEDSK